MTQEKTYKNWGICGNFTGFLGRDTTSPRRTQHGTAVTDMSVAIKTDVAGQDAPATTWAKVTLWKELAEAWASLPKGTLVRVEFYSGHLHEWVSGNKSGVSFEVTAKDVLVRRDGKWASVVESVDDEGWPTEPPAGFEEETEIPF